MSDNKWELTRKNIELKEWIDKMQNTQTTYEAKITELEAELKESHVGTLTFTPQEYIRVKADAIREMANGMLDKVLEEEAFREDKPTSFKSHIIIATLKNVFAYADNLEGKSDESN